MCIIFFLRVKVLEKTFYLSLFFSIIGTYLCVNSTNFLSTSYFSFFSIKFYTFWTDDLNLNSYFISNFGHDNLNTWFIFLLFFIFPFCYYYLFDEGDFISFPVLFCLNFFFLWIWLFISFISLNLLVFYFCFESTLLPMYLIITLWGGAGWRKYKAGNYLYLYTAVLSSFIMFACYHFSSSFGTLNINLFPAWANFDGSILMLISWWGLFIGFAVKIPIFPFHLWLLEAHVEAPTVGSVLLASLLLKLGSYGLIRFSLLCFKWLSFSFSPIICALCICSMVYCSLLAICQIDLKKIIAYSSIVHMNFAVLGFFSGTVVGFVGGLIMNISHAFVSAALFFLSGILYRRFETRTLSNLSGLYVTMPLFVIFFFLFMLANLGFPFSLGFISEFLIFLGLCSTNFISVVGLIFCGYVFVFNLIYCIWTAARLSFGQLNCSFQDFVFFYDLSQRETVICINLISLTIMLGLKPNILISTFETINLIII